MEYFNDKVIIVTGASEGIGRAVSKTLASDGAKVVVTARNEERLVGLQKEIESEGGEAFIIPADLTELDACKNVIDKTAEKFGGIDCLVNNAGGTMWTTLDEITDVSIFERLMKLNYLASVHCTYYALPHLKKSKGLIVGISSVAGLTGVPTRTAYCGSKHAMFGFFNALRVELRNTGVSVTMVAPDFVRSKIHERALGPDGKPFGVNPMSYEKIQTAEECAEIIKNAMKKRKRTVLTSNRTKLGLLVGNIFPSLGDKIKANLVEKAFKAK
jgi:short-subunit dehydrogenase